MEDEFPFEFLMVKISACKRALDLDGPATWTKRRCECARKRALPYEPDVFFLREAKRFGGALTD